MGSQRLSPRSTRRIARATGQDVIRALAHGGYVHSFVTARHLHCWYNVKTQEWGTQGQDGHWSSCDEMFPVGHPYHAPKAPPVPWSAGPGASGFDGREDAEFAIGTVSGVRVWSLTEDGTLTGQQGYAWADGENLALCPRGHAPPSGDDYCGCGFYAYWELSGALVFAPASRPVAGIVEGYGRTMIGDRGFRSAKARIVALCLAFEVYEDSPARGGWRDAAALPQPHPDAFAIKAGFEHSLALRYPSARICMTQKSMLALHPPTRDYLPDREPEPERETGHRSFRATAAAPPPGGCNVTGRLPLGSVFDAVTRRKLGQGWTGRIINIP